MSGRIKTYVAQTGGTWAIPGRAPAPGGGTSTKTLLRSTIDDLPTEDPINVVNMRKVLGITSGGGATTVARTGVRPSTGQGKVVVQHHHANLYGTADGISWSAPLAQSCTEATIELKIKFTSVGANPFHWGLGGKFPGLGGVVPGKGNPPSGGTPSAYGWSGRGMWLYDTVGGNVTNKTEFISYIYDPTQTKAQGSTTYGKNRHTLIVPEADTWHTVKQYYKMNDVQSDPTAVDATTGDTTGGSWSTNGVHRVWVDGVLGYENTAQVFRKFKAGIITHLFWSVFYGGSDAAWGAPWDTDIEIDDVVVELLAA